MHAAVQAAKEVSTALTLNYPSSSDMAAICGYERPLDRCGPGPQHLHATKTELTLPGVHQVAKGCRMGSDSASSSLLLRGDWRV